MMDDTPYVYYPGVILRLDSSDDDYCWFVCAPDDDVADEPTIVGE